MKKILLLIVFLLLHSQVYATNWCEDADIEGCWTFEEASGNIEDQSTNNIDGTVSGCSYRSTGKFTYGLSFDGSNDYVNFGDVTFLDGKDDATFVIWLKTASDFSSLGKAVSVFRKDGSWTPIQYNNSESKWKAHLWTTSFASHTLSDGYVSEDDSYNHYAYTYNSSTRQAYKNAVAFEANFNDTGNMADAATNFYLGGNAAAENYAGKMDDVAIFSIALDSTDIDDIMDNGLVQTAGATRNRLMMVD